MFAFRCFLQFETLETFFSQNKGFHRTGHNKPHRCQGLGERQADSCKAGSCRQPAQALEAFPAQQQRSGALLIGGPG